MNDRYRPLHHLSPVSGWLNDPNGPIQIDGTYHVFAQFNPIEAVHGNIHLAHWTSTDLVDWSAQPIALTPDTSQTGTAAGPGAPSCTAARSCSSTAAIARGSGTSLCVSPDREATAPG